MAKKSHYQNTILIEDRREDNVKIVFDPARIECAKTHVEQTKAAGLVYRQSGRGRAKRQKWQRERAKTEAFKNYQRKWSKTEKGKAARRKRVNKYAVTPKGIAARKRKVANKRSARQINNTLTAEDWGEILIADGYACHYCRTPYTSGNPATQDHVIPISKGGHHVKENIVSSCRSCNTSKHNKDFETWKKRK